METKIRGSGGIRLDLDLIYYPLGELWYAINYKGNKGVVSAQPVYEDDEFENKVIKKKKQKPKIKYWYLPVDAEDTKLIFDDDPINKDMPYNNPITPDLAREWTKEPKKVQIDKLYMEIKEVLQTLYDFSDERDLDIIILGILQSWFSDVLKAVFYVDVRSQMGGGKTILLEIMQGLSRYGVLANDMSFAVIPRIIDRYKCSLYFDEIDMINKHVIEDVFKILRTGYRKGQKYIRAKPKTFEPEVFDCYGFKAFNYRSDVADDLKNRSLPVNTSKSHDKVLPMINLYKDDILKPIAYKIFCFYMDSLFHLQNVNSIYKEYMNEFISSDKVNRVNRVNEIGGYPEMYNNTNSSLMRIHFLSFQASVNQKLFCHFLSGSGSKVPVFDKKGSVSSLTPLTFTTSKLEQNPLNKDNFDAFNTLFEKLTGRNIEIFSLIINLCSYLNLDIYKNFKEILEEKAEFEDHDEEDLKNILREVLIEKEVGARTNELLKMKYVYYREVQSDFMKKTYENYGYKPNPRQIKKFLRELGFVDKKNKKVMHNGNSTMLALIYDKSINKNLGLERDDNL